MYMPLKPYFTITPSLLLQQNKDNAGFENTNLNIILSSETEFTPHLYSILDKVENKFIISICDSLLKDQSILQALLSKVYILLALNKSINRQRILPVFSDSQYQHGSLNIEMCQTYFNQQGVADIKLPIFDYSLNGIQTIDNCSLFVMNELPPGLQNAYSENKNYSTTMIIAFRNEITDFAMINDVKKQIIADEKNHILKTDISPYSMENEEFESEIELWKKRTLLYQVFLSLSKKIQEKEYYDVLNWYQKEYEILPLWYKRLGHIIKVIMGKRSFRSLFRDDVKKYKD